MKSIDEGCIDFHKTTDDIKNRSLEDMGYEIKKRLRTDIGNIMRCNIGIGPNRFLAKIAAELHKPDGLDVINSVNLRETFSKLKLTDLTGIAKHNEYRLNSVGIYTTLEFLDADLEVLRDMVFKSVNGKKWYMRLRGYEVDDADCETKTIGRQYVLESRNLSYLSITQKLHQLCESVGSRLRSQNKVARGVFVYAKTEEKGYWHTCRMCEMPFFSDNAIYTQARNLFLNAPSGIIEIGIRCYGLEDGLSDQISIFEDDIAKEMSVTDAVDAINARFGERTIHSSDTLNVGPYMKQKVPFGSTRFLK